MSDVDPILEAARLRYDTFEVMGRTFTVRQPSALQLIGYRQALWEEIDTGEADDQGKPKMRRQLRHDATEQGLAYLISVCVLGEDAAPAYTKEQGLTIVNGNPDVGFPFINAVTALLSGEKKSSVQKTSSGTA